MATLARYSQLGVSAVHQKVASAQGLTRQICALALRPIKAGLADLLYA